MPSSKNANSDLATAIQHYSRIYNGSDNSGPTWLFHVGALLYPLRSTYTFDELDEQQTKAALYVLELADIEPTRENARLYLAWDVLSFTEDAQGRYCWYMDDEGNEACIKVDSLEIIETSEYE